MNVDVFICNHTVILKRRVLTNKAKADWSKLAVRAKPDDVNYQWNKMIKTQPKHSVFHVVLIVTVCTG